MKHDHLTRTVLNTETARVADGRNRLALHQFRRGTQLDERVIGPGHRQQAQISPRIADLSHCAKSNAILVRIDGHRVSGDMAVRQQTPGGNQHTGPEGKTALLSLDFDLQHLGAQIDERFAVDRSLSGERHQQTRQQNGRILHDNDALTVAKASGFSS